MPFPGPCRLAAALLLALAPALAAATDVAVLLPASGRMSRAADAIRDGLVAAYYQDSARGADTPTLNFYDSDSAPVAELVRRAHADGARLVIGPLDRERVEALAKAGPLPLPVLALNSAPVDAPGLLQFALSPEDEIARLVEWMGEQGVRRPLLLAAGDEGSQRQLRLFQSAWQQRHPAAAPVALLDPARKGGIAATVKELLAGAAGRADALFLASPALARQVLPALAYYRSARPLYSLSAAWEPGGEVSDINDLDGLHFCDLPWMLETARPEQEALYAAQPRPAGGYDRLYAFGADAWTLATQREALLAGERLSLRSGEAWLEGGTLRRLPTCAEVRNGSVFPVRPDAGSGR